MAALQSFAGTVDTAFELTSFSAIGWKSDVVNVSFENNEAVLTNAAVTPNYWDYQYWLFDVTIAGVGADNKSMSVYYPNWQNSRTVTTDYQDVDAETSVKAVRSVTEDGPWYIGGGVKVASPSSGIYIHNGSKVCKKQ